MERAPADRVVPGDDPMDATSDRPQPTRDADALYRLLFTLAPSGLGAPDVATPQPTAAKTNGTETVLVVEDDALVREVTVRFLRSGGYRVLVAASGRDGAADRCCRARRVQYWIEPPVEQ